MFTYPENWNKMSLKERQAARLAPWLEPEMEFGSPEAEKGYKERARLIADAIMLKKPARVPVVPWWGCIPGALCRHHRKRWHVRLRKTGDGLA